MQKKSINKSKDTEKILIENFVSLQKVMTNLSTKFDSLTHQISKLLDLFEISAKALAEKDFELEKNNRENMRILEKIENVLEQNKTIARGLTLMHDRINEPKSYTSQQQFQERPHTNVQSRPQVQPKPLSEETKRMLFSPVGNPAKFTPPTQTNEQ